ncbi:Uncharacterised protein [Bordetella pertussis]|nr:Uncharacterised protein [Bordetella pertussis]
MGPTIAARLASRFQAAWAMAASTTKIRDVYDITLGCVREGGAESWCIWAGCAARVT